MEGPKPISFSFLSIGRAKKVGETCHGILISSHVSHFMPDSASFCSSNNSSQLRSATSGHIQVGHVRCSFTARDHSSTSQRQATAITLELLPDLLPQVTFCRTSMCHLVPRPIPSGWKGCFSFSKRTSPCSGHYTEIGRGRQGLRSLCQFPPSPGCLPPPAAPAPTTLAHIPGACRQEIVLIFFFIWQALTQTHLHISVLHHPSSSF